MKYLIIALALTFAVPAYAAETNQGHSANGDYGRAEANHDREVDKKDHGSRDSGPEVAPEPEPEPEPEVCRPYREIHKKGFKGFKGFSFGWN